MIAETQIFDLFPANPVARTVLVILFIVFGWQSKGFVRAWREDRRTSDHHEVDLLGLVEKITSDKLAGMSRDLADETTARRELERRANLLERRVGQLELYIEAKGDPLPPWPTRFPPH